MINEHFLFPKRNKKFQLRLTFLGSLANLTQLINLKITFDSI